MQIIVLSQVASSPVVSERKIREEIIRFYHSVNIVGILSKVFSCPDISDALSPAQVSQGDHIAKQAKSDKILPKSKQLLLLTLRVLLGFAWIEILILVTVCIFIVFLLVRVFFVRFFLIQCLTSEEQHCPAIDLCQFSNTKNFIDIEDAPGHNALSDIVANLKISSEQRLPKF